MGRPRHRLVGVDSHATISRRKESLAPAHHHCLRCSLRAVPHVHDTFLASAICIAYLHSVSSADHVPEPSFHVFLRLVRQDIALAELVLFHIPLPQMRA